MIKLQIIVWMWFYIVDLLFCLADNHPKCPEWDNDWVEFVKTENSEASSERDEDEKNYSDQDENDDSDDGRIAHGDHQFNNYLSSFNNNEGTHVFRRGPNFVIHHFSR